MKGTYEVVAGMRIVFQDMVQFSSSHGIKSC